MTGDFKLFNKLDSDSDGGVTAQEWHTYLRSVYQERGVQKAVKWVTTLLHTLRSVTSDDAGGSEITDTQAGARMASVADAAGAASVSDALQQEAKDLFTPLAALQAGADGGHATVSKSELVAAQGGDFNLFSKMDAGTLAPFTLANPS